MPKQYWVIGGEYRDADFHEIDEETSHVYGPFRNYDEANQVWRDRSMSRRSEARVRYAIVVSAPSPRMLQQVA